MWQLYKYHSLSKNHLNNLARRKLWASHPTAFNDPFEFRLQRTHHAKGLSELRKLNPNHANRSDAELISMGVEGFESYIQKMGVICFSEEPHHILLWSHYTGNHSGICLGFCGRDESETLKDAGIYPVKYEESYPEVDFAQVWHMEGLAKILWTKNKVWSYEKEWRMVRIEGNELVDYPGKLNKIIFGLRTSEADQELVRSLLRDDDDVEFFHVVQDDKRYKLHVRAI